MSHETEAARSMISLAVFVLAVPAWTQNVDPDLDERLEALATEIEQSLDEYHAPGAALAVVRDGEVIFARGFGLADVENRIPATPETPFFIGSTTKAFTATLIGMLVDEGMMDWDDPIEDYLPYFTLAVDSEDPEAQVTIRDLLSHRTGFPRMAMLWANGTLSSDEILRRAAMAEPFAPFRERFYYNNVQYLAAGTAAGVAAGDSWSALIEERIIVPLGMSDTRTVVRDARADDRTARGYTWNERLESFWPDPSDPESPGVDPIAPAGSISSTALDMAAWIRFLLADGVVDDEPLISPESLEETRTAQIEVAPGASYGMGWIVRDWQGQPLIAHDGGVPGGFSTIVALLPESDFGFVFLTNALQPLLPGIVLGRVPEILLGPPPTPPRAITDADDLDDYLGRYVANFAAFSNEVFTVLEQNGRLALDIPSQTEFVLNPPDDEGRWQFALTDQIAVSFNRDDDGKVVGLTVHQAGMAFEVPREGVEVKPDIDLAELERYRGSYSGPEGLQLGVVIQNQRLAVRLPNNKVLDLHPPDAEGRWAARANAELAVAFEETDDGTIAAMSFYRPGGLPVIRLVPGETMTLPSIDAILELRGVTGPASRAEASTTSRSRSRIRFPHAAVEGVVEVVTAGDDRLRIDVDLGEFGQSRIVVDGDRGWSESSSEWEPFRELTGEMLRQTLLEHPAVIFGDWRAYYDSVDVVRADEVGERVVYLVRLESADLPPKTLAVDAETGDILRVDRTLILPGGLGRLPVTTTYEDYREVGGARVPFRSIETNEAMGRTIYETISVDSGVELEPETFTVDIPEEWQ